jgi:hypothetical protein
MPTALTISLIRHCSIVGHKNIKSDNKKYLLYIVLRQLDLFSHPAINHILNPKGLHARLMEERTC